MALKDKKHWSDQSEAARDEVRDAVEEAVDWVLTRHREAAIAAGGVVVGALLLGLFLYSRQARANEAWDKLSQAEIYAYSGRPADSETVIKQVTDGNGSAAASALADMLAGDLKYPGGKFDEAAAAYGKAAAEAPEALRPFALAEKVLALEAAGKSAECAAAAQSFLDATPENLLAASVHTALARCQLAAGSADAAKQTLQRIALQYPNTPWAEWATARLAPPAAASAKK